VRRIPWLNRTEINVEFKIKIVVQMQRPSSVILTQEKLTGWCLTVAANPVTGVLEHIGDMNGQSESLFHALSPRSVQSSYLLSKCMCITLNFVFINYFIYLNFTCPSSPCGVCVWRSVCINEALLFILSFLWDSVARIIQ